MPETKEAVKLPYAEDVNYWKTGQSQPETWLDRAEKQIETLGGKVRLHALGQDSVMGTAAYMMMFQIKGDQFKVVWPVLPVHNDSSKNQLAARRQAATMLFYDVKAKCLAATVKGHRRAFFEYLQLPDGRTVSELTDDEAMGIPSILQGFVVKQIK